VVYFENAVSFSRHCVFRADQKTWFQAKNHGVNCGTADALYGGEAIMKTNINFIQLISSVVGLSLGIGVATATALLGVAALLQ
jgi:hypothetical protein